MVGLVDIAATITELAGVPRGDAEQSDGASLIPLMAGTTTEHHPVLVIEDDYRAVMSGDHKLVVDIKEGRYALYDVDGDPGERWNLFMRPGYEALSREFYLLYQASPVSPVFNK